MNSILVIEEKDKGLREGIISALAKEGFKIAAATNCEDALLMMDEFKPSLIILGDATQVDSFEACYQLRQEVGALILMLGTVFGDDAWPEAVEAGADFYLVRPFSYTVLVARVQALLRRYELTRSKYDEKDSHRAEV